MTNKKFNRYLDEKLEEIKRMLGKKQSEYSANGDRFHNFKRAAEIIRCTPEQALRGMLVKQLVSVFDMLEKGATYTGAHVKEKCGDVINYMILLEAMLLEGLKK